MKKQHKIIIGAIIAIAVIIIVISFFFPRAYQGLTRGTIGKAEKYRQEQMSEKDIQLRSEFTEDTVQLHQMISGLIYFTLFTENLSATIDSCLVSFRYQGIDKDPANSEVIGILTEYNTYLKNNSQTLVNTTRILADFYLGDTVTLSLDVEKNIRDFAVYVDQLGRKDSVLTESLSKLDHFLIGNKLLQKNQEAIRNLKAIRDQLLIKSTQLMALTGNKNGLARLLSYGLQSQSQFSGIGSLRSIASQSALNVSNLASIPVPSSRELQAAAGNLNVSFSAASSLQSGPVSSQIKSGPELNVIIYDRSSLSLKFLSSSQLNVVYGAEKLNNILKGVDPNLGVVGFLNNKNLGVVMNAAVLSNILSSRSLSSFFSAQQLNDIIPAKELASSAALNSVNVGSSASLQMSLGGNASLLNVIYASSGLQKMVLGNGAINGFSSLQRLSFGSFPEPK